MKRDYHDDQDTRASVALCYLLMVWGVLAVAVIGWTVWRVA